MVYLSTIKNSSEIKTGRKKKEEKTEDLHFLHTTLKA